MVDSNYRVYRALTLAAWAHEGQEYRPGESYFMAHIIEVWKKALEDDADEDTQIICALHDVLEDTSIHRSTIQKEFGKEILYELELLDKSQFDSYEEYLHSLRFFGSRAISAKIYDLECNLEGLNHPKCPENKHKNREKYEKALEYLRESWYGEPPDGKENVEG